jgi:hypothetical protein
MEFDFSFNYNYYNFCLEERVIKKNKKIFKQIYINLVVSKNHHFQKIGLYTINLFIIGLYTITLFIYFI